MWLSAPERYEDWLNEWLARPASEDDPYMHYEEWMNSGEWSTQDPGKYQEEKAYRRLKEKIEMYSGEQDNYYGAKTYSGNSEDVVGRVDVTLSLDPKDLTETQKFAIGLTLIMRYEPDAEVQGDIEEFWVGMYSYTHKLMTRQDKAIMKHCGWEKDDYYDCWNFKLKGGDVE